MSVHRIEPLESDMAKSPEYITFRFKQIQARRAANKMARSRGFRNYAEMSEYVA
jgi:hypothetical protein